jgi:lipocalin-like protein
MKSAPLLLFGFLVCAASGVSQTESEIRDRIVGTWKLVSAEDIMKDGTTRPYPTYGPHGKGFLMYQRDGYMCADLVNPDRPKWVDPVHTTPEERSLPPTAHSPTVAGTRSTQSKGRSFISRK